MDRDRGVGGVGILGVAQTRYGVADDRSLEERIFAITNEALSDAGIGHDAIDSVVAGCNDQFDGRAISIMITDGAFGGCGLDVLNTASTGEHALILAYMRLRAGLAGVTLVIGWSDLVGDSLRVVQGLASDPIYHRQLGMHDVVSYGLQAGAYEGRYGPCGEAAAAIVLKNRRAGMRNPLAALRQETTREAVLGSPVEAWPIRAGMTGPLSSGIVAMVVASRSWIDAHRRAPIAWVRGVGWSSDRYWLGERDLTALTSLATAARMAYGQAAIANPMAEIDVCEIHDVTAYHELMVYEALGFCGPGEGPRLAEAGLTGIDSDLPVNPSGGSLCANPYFATGLVRVAEAALQVGNRAGDRQVAGAKVALAQATSGFAGQNNSVVILSSGNG